MQCLSAFRLCKFPVAPHNGELITFVVMTAEASWVRREERGVMLCVVSCSTLRLFNKRGLSVIFPASLTVGDGRVWAVDDPKEQE